MLNQSEWMENGVGKTSLRVRYAETDAMGIVHHSSYIVWFEEGRSSFMRSAGFPYSQIEKTGFYLTVTEVTARYRQPARYDDLLMIHTRLGELRSRGLRFDYEIVRAVDKALLVSGHTKHICITHTGAPTRIPAAFLEQLQPLQFSTGEASPSGQ